MSEDRHHEPRWIIRDARADELIDLRHAVLRIGLPRETAVFPGDDAPTTRHFAAVIGEQVIGCATLVQSIWQNEPAWQLRGMAVAPPFRGRGVGRALLIATEQAARQSPLSLLWCNARTPAAPFYQDHGWEIVSEQFIIETAGPHVRMIKRLS